MRNFASYSPEWLEIINLYSQQGPVNLGPFSKKSAKTTQLAFYRWRARALQAARAGDPFAAELVPTLIYLAASMIPLPNGQYHLTIDRSALSKVVEQITGKELR